MKALQAWLKLIRWKNLMIIIMVALFCRYLLLEPVYLKSGTSQAISNTTFVILLISLVLLSAGGYVFNSVMDIRIDTYNKAKEVVLGKVIDLHDALKVYYGLTILGILLGGIAAWKASAFQLCGMHLVAAGLFWSYSFRYKKVFPAGNIIVALLSAMLFPTFWIFEFFALRTRAISFAAIVPQMNFINHIVISFFVFAFLITLIREIVKDIEDMEGDRRYDCKSLPLRLGLNGTLIIIAVLSLIISVTSWIWLPRTTGQYLLINNIYILIFIILPLIITPVYLFIKQDKRSIMICSRILKFCMITGIISLVFPIIQ